MEVFFCKNSAAEKGTLYQLKNLLHWSADPGDNIKAAEDFSEVVLQAHIAAAAETIYDASSTQLNPG